MLRVAQLWKAYLAEGDRVRALRGVSFHVQRGEFYTLLGPSGCGKSTTLRCIAGLEQPDEGEIEIAGRLVHSVTRGVSVPVHQRDIGMVFQSYAIWPHMNVFDNVAFPLMRGKARHSRREARGRVERALSLVQLEGMEKRPASLLSGGQQQRVALARALVYEPAMLLLDEPLSNLDAKLREEMRKELKQLVRQLGITTLYVTHDQMEALSLSDRIAVMHDGTIVQEGPPQEIYFSPRHRFVASFVGKANLIDGAVQGRDEGGGVCLVETPVGLLRARVVGDIGQQARALVSVRPEAIRLHTSRPETESNLIVGKVEALNFLGDATECQIRVNATLVEVKEQGLLGLEIGQTVYLQVPVERSVVVSP